MRFMFETSDQAELKTLVTLPLPQRRFNRIKPKEEVLFFSDDRVFCIANNDCRRKKKRKSIL